MPRPRILPLLLLACALLATAVHSRALKELGGAAGAPKSAAAPAAGGSEPLPPVPQATFPVGAIQTASPACLDAWLQATAQKTVAAACKVLAAMPPKCVGELQLQAMLEEAVAGAAGLEAYVNALLQQCGIALPVQTTTSMAAGPGGGAGAAGAPVAVPEPAGQAAAATHTKPGCSPTDAEDCYQYADDRDAVEECMQRNDERVRCCKSTTTTIC